jgi:hypothetical protein
MNEKSSKATSSKETLDHKVIVFFLSICLMPFFYVGGLIYGFFKKTPSTVPQIAEIPSTRTDIDSPKVSSSEVVNLESEPGNKKLGKFSTISDEHKAHILANGDRCVLSLYVKDRVITRTIRKLGATNPLNGRYIESKTDMAHFTPEVAKEFGFDWTMAGALAFTCKELNKEIRVELKQSAPKPSSTVALKVAQDGTVSSEEQMAEEQPKRIMDQRKGTVIRMGKVSVAPKKGKSYETFTVSLKESDGSFVDFSGVELERMAMKNIFKRGDYVQVTKYASEEISKVKDGEKSTFSTTPYAVVVLQQA